MTQSTGRSGVGQEQEASAVAMRLLAGGPIHSVLSHAPGSGAAIGGVKVRSDNGWFAARPSGTKSINQIYVGSFNCEVHLR